MERLEAEVLPPQVSAAFPGQGMLQSPWDLASVPASIEPAQ